MASSLQYSVIIVIVRTQLPTGGTQNAHILQRSNEAFSALVVNSELQPIAGSDGLVIADILDSCRWKSGPQNRSLVGLGPSSGFT